MQSKINRITDILRRDDGISGAMHYTEQVSWILFLKFLNDYENEKAIEAELIGEDYHFVLSPQYRWHTWAAPKDAQGKLDIINADSGDDLLEFVNKSLFPYLKSFKSADEDPKSLKYKIGAIFEFLDNRIASGHTLRDVINEIDALNFNNKADLYQLSQVYENLLKEMGSDGGNSGEFYTPRPLVKAMVDVVNPQAGETVYDPASGTCGFLIDAYEHMYHKDLSTTQLKFLNEDTFFGKEKTPLSYVMGVMNMILHGVTSPNITKANTLVKDIRSLEEKDRYDVVLANPPFGGKEKSTIQANFPVKSNATELLFLQHIYKSLKQGGRCGVVIPEGVLFQTNNAFKSVKKELLENYNVHTIVSLPAGVFLPYSGVKTNVIFFDREGATTDIFYYEINPPYKLTKNKPIQFEHFDDFLQIWKARTPSENSWIVKVEDIKDYDISAKNPNKIETIEHKHPTQLVDEIIATNQQINTLMTEVKAILKA